jgi:hypothetical protein
LFGPLEAITRDRIGDRDKEKRKPSNYENGVKHDRSPVSRVNIAIRTYKFEGKSGGRPYKSHIDGAKNRHFL